MLCSEWGEYRWGAGRRSGAQGENTGGGAGRNRPGSCIGKPWLLCALQRVGREYRWGPNGAQEEEYRWGAGRNRPGAGIGKPWLLCALQRVGRRESSFAEEGLPVLVVEQIPGQLGGFAGSADVGPDVLIVEDATNRSQRTTVQLVAIPGAARAGVIKDRVRTLEY